MPLQLALQVPNENNIELDDAADYRLTTNDLHHGAGTFYVSQDASTEIRRGNQRHFSQRKVFDDVQLVDHDRVDAFKHTFEYLSFWAKNGVVFYKFQFCQGVAQFGGLQIIPPEETPSESILNAIINFSILKNIPDVRFWFGLVNQVTWVYSLSPIMSPFQDLVKQDSHFAWNQNFDYTFRQSTEIIVVGSVKKKGAL